MNNKLVVISKQQAAAVKLLKDQYPLDQLITLLKSTFSFEIPAPLQRYSKYKLLRMVTEGYSTDIRISKILIRRLDGTSAECKVLHKATGWLEANEMLKMMAKTAPKNVYCDKVHFAVIFNTGDVYTGTYALKQHDVIFGDLYRHVRKYCEFYVGKCDRLPAHIKSIEEYRQIIRGYEEPYTIFLEQFLYPTAN